MDEVIPQLVRGLTGRRQTAYEHRRYLEKKGRVA